MFSYKTSVHNLCLTMLSPTSQENYVIFFNHAKIFSFSWISSAMKNLHLSFKTLQVPLRSPCNLHSSFTINVQLDSLRCSKTLAMIIFLNCDNGIGQVSKFTCQPSKWMQRSFNYIHSGISKAQKRKFSWICIILASSLYCYLSVHFNITLSLLLLMALRL